MTHVTARPAALEGSLGELALPDVLQLLDLGRKTGALHVRAAPPGGDGVLVLVDGRIAGAALRERDVAPGRAGRDALVGRALAAPAAAAEAAAHELLGWRAGTFSFAPLGASAESAARHAVGAWIAVDTLLMESARRADEWARLEPRIPHLGVVPSLSADGSAAPLHLAPEDWSLLAAVDGVRDLRAVAHAARRDPLDAARGVDALVAAGVLALRDPAAVALAAPDAGPGSAADVAPHGVPERARQSSSW